MDVFPFIWSPICTFFLESLVSILIAIMGQILVAVQIMVQVSIPPLVVETGGHNLITSLGC